MLFYIVMMVYLSLLFLSFLGSKLSRIDLQNQSHFIQRHMPLYEMRLILEVKFC